MMGNKIVAVLVYYVGHLRLHLFGDQFWIQG